MARRFLAFDIETAKDVPGEDFNWRPHRPLGISCAATLASPSSEVVLWHGKTNDGAPAARMTRDDAAGLLRYLCKMGQEGFTILTWNGLGFDFDILAEEAGAAASCKECALSHVDMMFHIVCSLGYPVALDKGAQGMGLPGKPEGMTGLQAPKLWALGHHKEVLEYVSQDVRIAMQIAEAAERQRKFEWITRKGTKSKMPLPKGWLTVSEALKLPEARYLVDVESLEAPGLYGLVSKLLSIEPRVPRLQRSAPVVCISKLRSRPPVQVSAKGKYLSRRAVNQTLGLAAMWIHASLSGCSAGPPASASISQSSLITLYEGLPHQFYEPKALLAEKKAKPTVELSGFTFYGETLELNAGDAEELKALLAGSRSFVPFTEEKKCGGFHPDYAVAWSVGGETYRCLICLGCLEARIHGPGGVTEYDIENAAFKRLKQLLMPYRKNRPPASQELFQES